MQCEAEKYDTAMAAVVKLAPEQVQAICSRYTDVYPVNYNCPGQITVAGLSSQMTDFFADVKKADGRAIPLKVQGAFHSPFMDEVANVFAKELENIEIAEKTVKLYSNMTADVYTDDVVGLLSKQICNPVQWEKSIRNMITDGVDTFIEIGPGKTLTNMIKKINTDVKAVNVTEYLLEVEGC